MYVVKQKVKGHDYFYLRKSVREEGKVRSKNVAYLGKDRQLADKKAKKIIAEMNKVKNDSKDKTKMDGSKEKKPKQVKMSSNENKDFFEFRYRGWFNMGSRA